MKKKVIRFLEVSMLDVGARRVSFSISNICGVMSKLTIKIHVNLTQYGTTGLRMSSRLIKVKGCFFKRVISLGSQIKPTILPGNTIYGLIKNLIEIQYGSVSFYSGTKN